MCNLYIKKIISSTYKNVKPKRNSKINRKRQNRKSQRKTRKTKTRKNRKIKTRNRKNKRDNYTNFEQTTHQKIS